MSEAAIDWQWQTDRQTEKTPLQIRYRKIYISFIKKKKVKPYIYIHHFYPTEKQIPECVQCLVIRKSLHVVTDDAESVRKVVVSASVCPLYAPTSPLVHTPVLTNQEAVGHVIPAWTTVQTGCFYNYAIYHPAQTNHRSVWQSWLEL